MNHLTNIAIDWAIRSFGPEHVFNKPVRAARLVEEAVEFAQALDVPREQMHALIDMVYNRPVGDAVQELGGVAMTFAIAAFAIGRLPDQIFEGELRRVLQKSPEHFKKRNEEKLALGMTGR